MGRPPCCDKVGIKKGPWTPEEDIILVSYIQEHGPGNWRAVPTNTGLSRCSKSCRLRWTNYLRPGIKRGNFTSHEEGMIIHLQALLGNKWAAIATYLPLRTDNDIKNYWNTHLKKKLTKFQTGMNHSQMLSDSAANYPQLMSERCGDQRQTDSHIFSNQHSSSSEKISSLYASSADNISRLLQGWMRSSPQPNNTSHIDKFQNCSSSDKFQTEASFQGFIPPQIEHHDQGKNGYSIPSDEFEHNLSSHHLCRDSSQKGHENIAFLENQKAPKFEIYDHPPLSFLENWLFDEGVSSVEEVMDQIPIMF